MYLVKLKDGDPLARPFGDLFDEKLIKSKQPFNSIIRPSNCNEQQSNISIQNICFTVGDDHIHLYDCVYVQKPSAVINPKIDSHLETLDMLAKYSVKHLKVKGKMCKRNPEKSPLVTDFEFELETAEILEAVRFSVNRGTLFHNLYKYEVPTFNMSFTYRYNSEMVSILNEETDALRRKLLETYLVNNFTIELCQTIKKWEQDSLRHGPFFIDLYGSCYKSENRLRTHNRISQLAMKYLANHIINLTNDLAEKASAKLYLSRIYGLDKDKNLKSYKAYISTFHTLAYQSKLLFESHHLNSEVIISFKDECITIQVPVKFWEVELRFKEVDKDSKDSEQEFIHKQIYSIEEADFKLSLRKNVDNEVEFKILHFKIMKFIPIPRTNHSINMAMDHLVSSAIEEYMKSVMKRTFTDKKLQELAIKPNVHDDIFYISEE